jgi:dCTP deaminase
VGATVKYTESDNLVPALEWRSSVGRPGLQVRKSAGFGEGGFEGS